MDPDRMGSGNPPDCTCTSPYKKGWIDRQPTRNEMTDPQPDVATVKSLVETEAQTPPFRTTRRQRFRLEAGAVVV